MNIYYVGIDQSYRNSGIVVLDNEDNVVKFEVVQTLKDDGDYFTRSKNAAESIANVIRTIDEYSDAESFAIGIEVLAFGMRGSTLQTLAGLQYMIVNALREDVHDPQLYTPSAIKKIATGSGKASKEDMFNALPERVQKMFSVVTKAQGREDLADAYWIAAKAKAEQG